MEENKDAEATQVIDSATVETAQDEDKEATPNEKRVKKSVKITASIIAAIIVLGGAGSYAYAANKAYGDYEAQVKSAKAIDTKLVKKIEDAQNLAKATKDTDVLDKTLLDSLNASVKTGEAQKGSPKAEDVNRWALWDVSKAKTTVADDITAATKAISSIDAAMGKVDASKTAKQVKDAKDTLNKTITDAETLYKDSEGKVQDDKTRESLKTAIDAAKKTSDDKKADVKALNAQKDTVANAVKSVNDSKTAKEQADAEAKAKAEAEEAARQAAQQATQSQTQSYSNTSSRANSDTSTYSAPTQQAQTQQSTPQQSQTQNNGSSNSGYTKLCATGDTSGAESIFTPCN
jgi:colicin import membrane protein